MKKLINKRLIVFLGVVGIIAMLQGLIAYEYQAPDSAAQIIK